MALPARSTSLSTVRDTAAPLTALNDPPLSVERRMPVGPMTITAEGDGAYTARGRAVDPATLPARTRVNWPISRPPTGVKFAPASSEKAVDPCWPAATSRVVVANAAANSGSVDGDGQDQLVPPSLVTPMTLPVFVVTTHTSSLAQRTPVRSCPPGAPTSLALQ